MTTVTRKSLRPKYNLTKFIADLFITSVAAFFFLSIAMGTGFIH